MIKITYPNGDIRNDVSNKEIELAIINTEGTNGPYYKDMKESGHHIMPDETIIEDADRPRPNFDI